MGVSHLSLWTKQCKESEMRIRKQFGEEVQQLRRDAGYSSEEFAEIANISYETLKKIELGLVDPKTPRLQEKIAYALEKSFMVISL